MTALLRAQLPAQNPMRAPSAVTGPRPIATTAPLAIQTIQRSQVSNVYTAYNPATDPATRTTLLNTARSQSLDVLRLDALQTRVNQLENALGKIANAPVQRTNVTIHDVNKLKGIASYELRRQR